MERSAFYELILVIILVVILALLLNPAILGMTDTMLNLFLVALLVVFVAFISFIWKERSLDERENHHRLIANRVGFMVSASILLVAIIVESINHMLDPWLVIALGGMALGKVITRFILRERC